MTDDIYDVIIYKLKCFIKKLYRRILLNNKNNVILLDFLHIIDNNVLYNGIGIRYYYIYESEIT